MANSIRLARAFVSYRVSLQKKMRTDAGLLVDGLLDHALKITPFKFSAFWFRIAIHGLSHEQKFPVVPICHNNWPSVILSRSGWEWGRCRLS